MRAVVATSKVALTACGRFSFEPDPTVADATAAIDAVDGNESCVVTNRLIGYWPMNSNDVMGTTVFDRSGNGRNGTLVGSPAPIVGPGRRGQALDFEATAISYVDVGNLPVNVGPGESNTVVLWYYATDVMVDDVLVYLPPGTGPAPPRYDLWLTTPSNVPLLCFNGGSGDCWGLADPSLVGRWVHVAAVFHNGPTINGELYVDGALVASSCVFGTCIESRTAMTPVHLGGSDSTYSWHGKLDEVRIYDRALTPSEIQNLYVCF